MRDSITSQYKRDEDNTEDTINDAAKYITDKLKISDRVEITAKKEAYITLKDHKQHFYDNPKCRLINPKKSQIGKISKQMLQNINVQIRNIKCLKQWRNTTADLDWFRG